MYNTKDKTMKIETLEQYKEALQEVYVLMNKGESNLTETEKAQIGSMAKAIEHYEDHVLKIMPLTPSIATIVQLKLKERQLNQRSLSALIGIGTAKISQILNGKRQPDVQFLKAIHEKLGIDGNVLLEMV
jgi:HTH-type transcriptional regulator / antitoxin HigA